MTTTTVPAPGFPEPTADAQKVFRAVLDALAHPGRAYDIVGPAHAPDTLGPALAGVALTLLDEQSPALLEDADPQTTAYLAFHTGATLDVAQGQADFVFTRPSTFPDLSQLALGTDEAPHRSTTVILDARGPGAGGRFRGEGPGIDGSVVFDAPWAPEGFLDDWTTNNALFPRGVDLLIVGASTVTALPRTTRLQAEPATGNEF